MLEPGKYSAEVKTSDDFLLYGEDLKRIRQELFDARSKNVYFILQSRKGPRLMEFLFNEDELSMMNILTEHALPFLFETLTGDPDILYKFCVVDDAIYFGTTIENLVGEIREYIKLYGIAADVEVYTIIKTRGSKEIEGVSRIHADEDVREGYGHFFVNLLMSDIMSKGNCMEVEFPLVSYDFGKTVGVKDVFKRFYDSYNAIAKPCLTPKYSKKNAKDDGVFKFAVLFDNEESAFKKIRVYVKGNIMRLAFMSPCNVANNSNSIETLFETSNKDVLEIWRRLCVIMAKKAQDIPYGGTLFRNRQRTMVVLANYLISLKLFFSEKDRIGKIIRQCTGKSDIKPIIDRSGLYYLLWDSDFVEKFINLFGAYQSRPSEYLRGWTGIKSRPSKTQVFEVIGYPNDDEKQKLQDFNTRMLNSSRCLGEAMSALFFNQTVLVDQWHRSFSQTSNYRLRFGLNFSGLRKLLVDNCEWIDDDSFDSIRHKMHAWVDDRVDRGCIVPQYIIDYDKNQWDRVFRPGENEEVLLSSLTRFVSFVLGSIKRESRERFVPVVILKKFLSLIYIQTTPSLSDLLGMELIPSVNGLSFSDIIDDGHPAIRYDIVDYLRDMFILTYDNNSVELSKRFLGTELEKHTFFSSEVEDRIVRVIRQLCYDISNNHVALSQSYRLCNVYLLGLYRKAEECEVLKRCCENILGILHNIRNGENGRDIFPKLRVTFNQIRHYILPEDYPLEKEESYISECQKSFLELDFYINILLFGYSMNNNDLLNNYIDECVKKGFFVLRENWCRQHIDSFLTRDGSDIINELFVDGFMDGMSGSIKKIRDRI